MRACQYKAHHSSLFFNFNEDEKDLFHLFESKGKGSFHNTFFFISVRRMVLVELLRLKEFSTKKQRRRFKILKKLEPVLSHVR